MSAFLLQMTALLLLPVGVGLVMLALLGPVMALGCAAIVLAPELWFVGREIDLQSEGGMPE